MTAEITELTEPVRDGEIRVTVLGSGDPFVKVSQASASLPTEVGNPERDLFFFDLGSGALANYNGLGLPVTATTKVFLTHLHADHVGDMPTLLWSLAKAGRAPVFAQKAGVPVPFAEQVVNGAHTSPTMAGKVFARAGARVSVMWHLAVDHQVVGPAYADMRTQHDGPVTIAQDLTTFDIGADAIVTRQSAIDPARWPVLGPTTITGPPMSPPPEPPEWWAAALLTD